MAPAEVPEGAARRHARRGWPARGSIALVSNDVTPMTDPAGDNPSLSEEVSLGNFRRMRILVPALVLAFVVMLAYSVIMRNAGE